MKYADEFGSWNNYEKYIETLILQDELAKQSNQFIEKQKAPMRYEVERLAYEILYKEHINEIRTQGQKLNEKQVQLIKDKHAQKIAKEKEKILIVNEQLLEDEVGLQAS